MNGLDRCRHIQAGELIQVLRCDNLGMFHAVGQVRQPIFCLVLAQQGKPLQNLTIGGISNGMYCQRPASLRGMDAQIENIASSQLQKATLLRSFIWLQHGCGLRAKRTVSEGLNPAGPEEGSRLEHLAQILAEDAVEAFGGQAFENLEF